MSQALRSYTAADLFSGCGGFSYGFVRSGRFAVILGNDLKTEALRTFELNLAGTRGTPALLKGDIRAIDVEDVVATLAEKGVGKHELDCLMGGPPCQGFSQMRRSEEREGSEVVKFRGYDRLSRDPRNDLVLRFLEIAHALKPRFIVIENVPQMLRHGHRGRLGGLAESIERMLRQEMGYDVIVGVLNAADYGVPQLRERAVFVAARDGSASLPMPTHADRSGDALSLLDAQPWVRVEDALQDLPPPPAGRDALGGGPLELYPDVPLSDYAKSMRSVECFPHNHVTRSYHDRVLRIIREMRPGETWDSASERMRRRYERLMARAVEKGERRDHALKRLKAKGAINPSFYKRYYWSAYTRLAWDRPALTITANANFLGSGRFSHPEQERGITMREAARLQSFDDDFRFVTQRREGRPDAIGVGMDMIGEAVPPLLAQTLATHLASLLDARQSSRQSVTTRRLATRVG